MVAPQQVVVTPDEAMKAFLNPLRHPRRSPAKGFTLVELVVASAIGVVMVLAGVAASIGGYRSTARVINAQQLRDEWSRLTLLLNADIAESCQATVAGTTLTLRVINPTSLTTLAAIDPDATGPICTAAPTITYALAGQNLARTGPAVTRDGTLNFGTITGALVVSDAVTQFNPVAATGLAPSYQLTLSRAGANYSGDGATIESRPRTRTY
jgi:cell division protein FtsL